MKLMPVLCTAMMFTMGCKRAAVSDPVADLNAAAKRLRQPPKGLTYGDVRVDVRRTDSLVSPYAGTVAASLIAELSPGHFSETKFVLSLDYREGKWQFNHCTGTNFEPGVGESSFAETREEAGVRSGVILRSLALSP